VHDYKQNTQDHAKQAVQLDPYQLARIEGAKKNLAKAEQAGNDQFSLAYTVGSLKWTCSDLIELVESLTGDGQ